MRCKVAQNSLSQHQYTPDAGEGRAGNGRGKGEARDTGASGGGEAKRSKGIIGGTTRWRRPHERSAHKKISLISYNNYKYLY